MLQLERKIEMKWCFLPFCDTLFYLFRGQSIAFILQKQLFERVKGLL